MARRIKILVFVISAITAFILVVVVPNFIRARTTRSENACANNLRQIEGAKEQWALEFHKTTNDVPTWKDLLPYLGRGGEGKIPKCPHGGIYFIGRVGESPKCSFPGDSSE